MGSGWQINPQPEPAAQLVGALIPAPLALPKSRSRTVSFDSTSFFVFFFMRSPRFDAEEHPRPGDCSCISSATAQGA
jgi:hypothetical protein